jgi:hypothetical protein
MDPLRVCQTMLMLLQKLKENNLGIEEHAAVLRQLWDSLSGGLKTMESRHIAGHPEVARQCLVMINSLDLSAPSDSEDEQTFVAWARQFPHAKSLFPDPFITSLSKFLPAQDDVKFSHRLRRIRFFSDTLQVPNATGDKKKDSGKIESAKSTKSTNSTKEPSASPSRPTSSTVASKSSSSESTNSPTK